MQRDLGIELRVLERRSEGDGCQSVVCERPRNFHYAAGQWLDIVPPGMNAGEAKTFSFASSPTEAEILITFRDGVSAYKKRLQTVGPGDTLRMTQYGGGFRLNPRRPAVLVAGGIGMAVFRSMIREAADTRVNTSLRLIYLNSSQDFIFRQELEDMRTSFPALDVSYIATKTDGRLTAAQLCKLVPDIAGRDGFAAGPPAMVERTRALLLEAGIHDDRIQTDSFDGY